MTPREKHLTDPVLDGGSKAARPTRAREEKEAEAPPVRRAGWAFAYDASVAEDERRSLRARRRAQPAAARTFVAPAARMANHRASGTACRRARRRSHQRCETRAEEGARRARRLARRARRRATPRRGQSGRPPRSASRARARGAPRQRTARHHRQRRRAARPPVARGARPPARGGRRRRRTSRDRAARCGCRSSRRTTELARGPRPCVRQQRDAAPLSRASSRRRRARRGWEAS